MHCFGKLLIVVFVLTSCSDEPEFSSVRLTGTGKSSVNYQTAPLSDYGSHILMVNGHPVTFSISHINNGTQVLLSKFEYVPAEHEFLYLTPNYNDDKISLEIGLSKANGLVDWSKVEILRPHIFGTSWRGGYWEVRDAKKLLFEFHVIEEEGENVSAPETDTLEGMKKASKERAVSFVVIEASASGPNKLRTDTTSGR